MNELLKKIIKNIKEKAENSINETIGDYFDDEGLIICGKCHEKKTHKFISSAGQTYVVRCACKCLKEKSEKEKALAKQKQDEKIIKALKEKAFYEKNFLNYTFAKDNTPNSNSSKIAKRYSEIFPKMLAEQKGLVLYGPVGAGKTFLAACIANAVMEQKYSCLFTTLFRLINKINSTFDKKQREIDLINKFSLLLLDDFDTERNTDYVNEAVYNIIETRYESRKPMIITTNLEKKKFVDCYDIKKQRIYSRIVETCFFIQVEDNQRRIKMHLKAADDFKKEMGI